MSLKATILFLFFPILINAAQYRVTGAVTTEDRTELQDLLTAAEKEYLPRFGLTDDFQLNVYICKDLSEFRRFTGVHWWNGGHFKTGNRTIYLQRLKVLRQRGILRQTLDHEFLHYCLWRAMGRNLSLWIIEGLIINLSGQLDEMDCPSENVVFNDKYVKNLDRDLVCADRERQRLAYCRAGALVRRILNRRKVIDLMRDSRIPDRK